MQLYKILDNVIPHLGFELVDVEFTPAKLIRVYIDKEDGVSVDDCAFVSEHLSKLLLVENIDYNRLEVSSPGVERPLKKLENYSRFVGKKIKLKLHSPVNNQKIFYGILLGLDENSNIKLQLENQEIMLVAFDEINRARLVFEVQKGGKK